ncbi:RmlC-like cupin, partial [Stipitochalara longipes BDJ]
AFSVTNNSSSSIWVTEVPTYVRPYAIAHYMAGGCVIGAQVYRFPVTGSSSDYAFSLISTNAPGSTSLGVLPHIHEVHYENFFNYRGRFQLWTDKYNNENTRVLGPGDYGAVPHNTTHTFQILDPDTEMVGVIQPGGFEDLFYALSSANYSSSTLSPYNPSANDSSSSPPASVISSLQSFDVYAQLQYNPRRDAVNGTAPANTTWHNGANALATDAYTPYFVANDYGPKYLNSATQSFYQVIQPLVTPTQSAGNFTMSTITIAKGSTNSTTSHPGHTAFEILEGQLMVRMEGEVLSLLQGDVVFIPGNTTYGYWSEVAYTKFLHVGAGAKGLDTALIAEGEDWDSPVWP